MPVQPIHCHYFTQTGNGFLQTQADKFGPANADVFNLTAKFNLSTSQKAFAICKGVNLIQPQGADRVNLILRPYTQPIGGLNIKYFIYRGLQKSDFINGNEVAAQGGSASGFINKIRTDFNSFHGGSPVTFDAKYIGYDTTQPATDTLESFYFKESIIDDVAGTETQPFELPLIEGGTSLGNFAQGLCGIDVVLHYGDYKYEFDNGDFKFDLEYARANEAKITLSGSDVEKRLQREQSTQFIDIAAFYGMFAAEGKVVADVSGTKTEKIGVQIYNEILDPFFTKNHWYIYIQSDRTRSYNFYDNYTIPTTSNSLKLGITENALAEIPFGTFGWPVLINFQEQNPSIPNNLQNHLFLQLVTDNNNNAMLYGHAGEVVDSQQNFLNADALRQPPDGNGLLSTFTKTIHLTGKAGAEGAVNKNIAGLFILLYQGVQYIYQTVPEPTQNVISANYFDDVFDLINVAPLLTSGENSTNYQIASSKLNLISSNLKRNHQEISTVQTVTINDEIATGIETEAHIKRVTYLTDASDKMASSLSLTGRVSSETATSTSREGTIGGNPTFALPSPYYIEINSFTDGAKTIAGLLLKVNNGTLPNKIILGLTQSENDQLRSIITNNPEIKNPRIFLVDLFDDAKDYISPEGTGYRKYKLGLLAENALGVLVLFMPDVPVEIYALDLYFHFTEEYGVYIKNQWIGSPSLDLNLTI